MKLADVDLRGYGLFEEAAAAFRVTRYHLPHPWDYVYTNGKVLWRINHDGTGYLQIDPPGGPALFRRERGETAPDVIAWIIPEGDEATGAFTNFWRPTVPLIDPAMEPDCYECRFAPDAAEWRLEHEGWLVETMVLVPPDAPAMVMTVKVTNTLKRRRACTVMPAVKPHLAPFSLAPWDVPSAYQTAAACPVGEATAVWMETRDPGGVPSRRLRAAVVCDMEHDAFEVAARRFAGRGDWSAPEAVWAGELALKSAGLKGIAYGKVSERNAIVGQPILAAFAKRVTLAPGRSYSFSLVFGKLPQMADGSLPPRAELMALAKLLSPVERRKARRPIRTWHECLFAMRSLSTPDEALNRYVNEWLPLQLHWVTMLDRGWPTGMRGTRDAAQDTTGIIPLDAAAARARLVEILSLQRSDGWFLRQYSTAGRKGIHDARNYVDAGCWVWEFLFTYLCFTRDFTLLKTKLGWLDAEGSDSVLDHALRIFDYYLAKENFGEHGLCKIGEGDWNDSVNRAGVEGRGESVMVSCQAVLGMEQCADLLDYLNRKKHANRAKALRAGAAKLRNSLLKHSLNREGYLNGVFNDAGKWIFSPKDPDGRRRVNGPVNSFAVIAGILKGQAREKAMDALDSLKGPHGWRLFYPGIGDPPISNLGRIGAGDKVSGLSENATCYNHGSHGFLGRATCVAGRGTMFYEIMRYMLPYDQQAHPVEVAKTAPYAVVNHWREIAGQDGHGGDTFLSGSITTAIRNIYQGMIGFRPGLDEVVIDPVLPKEWEKIEAVVRFQDTPYRIVVTKPKGIECGAAEVKLDGKVINAIRSDPRVERPVAAIPMKRFKKGHERTIEVRLG